MKQGKILAIAAIIMMAAHSAPAQNGSIDELHFPYGENYIFHLSGEKVMYDKYNFPSKTYKQTMKYRSYNPQVTKKGTVVQFELKLVSTEEKSDSNDVQQSFLTLNDGGMSWYGIDEKTGKKNKPTQAVKLPMYMGTTWNTSLGGKKTGYQCLLTDTVIETSLGKLQAFAVKSTQVIDGKDYAFVVEWVEYYSQYVGKIATDERQYFVLKGEGRTLNHFTEKLRLSYTNLSEEWRKKLLFAE